MKSLQLAFGSLFGRLVGQTRESTNSQHASKGSDLTPSAPPPTLTSKEGTNAEVQRNSVHKESLADDGLKSIAGELSSVALSGAQLTKDSVNVDDKKAPLLLNKDENAPKSPKIGPYFPTEDKTTPSIDNGLAVGSATAIPKQTYDAPGASLHPGTICPSGSNIRVLQPPLHTSSAAENQSDPSPLPPASLVMPLMLSSVPPPPPPPSQDSPSELPQDSAAPSKKLGTAPAPPPSLIPTHLPFPIAAPRGPPSGQNPPSYHHSSGYNPYHPGYYGHAPPPTFQTDHRPRFVTPTFRTVSLRQLAKKHGSGLFISHRSLKDISKLVFTVNFDVDKVSSFLKDKVVMARFKTESQFGIYRISSVDFDLKHRLKLCLEGIDKAIALQEMDFSNTNPFSTDGFEDLVRKFILSNPTLGVIDTMISAVLTNGSLLSTVWVSREEMKKLAVIERLIKELPEDRLREAALIASGRSTETLHAVQVFNLNWRIKLTDLQALLRTLQLPEPVKMALDYNVPNRQPKQCSATMHFASAADAEQAYESLQKYEPWQGCPAGILNVYNPTRNLLLVALLGGPSRHLYVGNIRWNATVSEIHEAFSAYGDVYSVKKDLGRYYAFVSFFNCEDAEEALTQLNGTKVHSLLMPKGVMCVEYCSPGQIPLSLIQSLEKQAAEHPPKVRPVKAPSVLAGALVSVRDTRGGLELHYIERSSLHNGELYVDLDGRGGKVPALHISNEDVITGQWQDSDLSPVFLKVLMRRGQAMPTPTEMANTAARQRDAYYWLAQDAKRGERESVISRLQKGWDKVSSAEKEAVGMELVTLLINPIRDAQFAAKGGNTRDPEEGVLSTPVVEHHDEPEPNITKSASPEQLGPGDRRSLQF